MILGCRGVRAARAALVLCAAVVLLTGLAGPAAAEDDGLRVFCLSPAQRGGLVDAADALGLARRGAAGDTVLVDGAELSPTDWRARRPDDFTRACEALSDSLRPAADVLTNILPFLTGLFGAFLAFAASAWRDRVSRGRTLADNLRTAVVDFHHVAERYLRSWAPGQSDTDVVAKREKLVAQLAVVRAAHRRWRKVYDLQDELSTGGLGRAMARDRGKVDELTRRLDRARDGVLEVAHALERPLWPHRRLRASRTGAGSDAP